MSHDKRTEDRVTHPVWSRQLGCFTDRPFRGGAVGKGAAEARDTRGGPGPGRRRRDRTVETLGCGPRGVGRRRCQLAGATSRTRPPLPLSPPPLWGPAWVPSRGGKGHGPNRLDDSEHACRQYGKGRRTLEAVESPGAGHRSHGASGRDGAPRGGGGRARGQGAGAGASQRRSGRGGAALHRGLERPPGGIPRSGSL